MSLVQCRVNSILMAFMIFVVVLLLWGGQTKAHSQAQEDSWNKILAFLEQNLYSNTVDLSHVAH